jgi:predicted Zn-dependent peptidase
MQKRPRTPASPHTDTTGTRYQKTTLDNGIRVVTESFPHVRSISVGVWANIGSRDESEQQNGISHFLEHMVFKGTKNRSMREIAQSLESLGGYLNAFTTKEQTCFYARVLDTHLPQAMDVVADLLLNPTFDRRELDKERLVVIEELKNAEDDPEDIIHDYYEKALFPNHSLGFPIIGTEANLRRFSQEDLRNHLGSHYLPSRMVVAAAGNVDHAQLVKLSERYFKRLHLNGVNHRRAPGPTGHSAPIVREYPRPIKQSHVCLGTIGYSVKHRDRYPLVLLNTLLGEGMSSRLHQTIREKYGYAYQVYSFVNLLSDSGVFGAYIGTDKKNLGSAIDLLKGELEKLKTKPVSAAELARTKAQIKGGMMLGLENMSSRMMRLGSSELYFEKYQTLDSVTRHVDAVTPEALRRVANDVFDPDTFTTVIIRPD